MGAIQQYGNQERLLYNQRYFITVSLPDRDFDFSFVSRYDPYFVPTRIVQSDLGAVLTDVPVADVAMTIWQTSLEVLDIMQQEDIQVPDTPSRPMQQAVRYMTNYQILLSVLSGRHATAGQVQERLRDLTVHVQVSRPQAEGLLAQWKALADEALSLLVERAVIGRSFVKAGRTEFPWGRVF